ncbi:hypothetical protein BS50DRAFT_633569 [Corynespora cassiicola Philippines]|uniref:Serine/threonine-protein kinase ppk6 n=1 Tax=Corynespora cassiicola Philippines TaxID=1448308 RepID=A0A2T2NR49_CORCC|nr:hypothetical protein BS50DRAFT_633569 [Corynespora cassiicola Philippines]
MSADLFAEFSSTPTQQPQQSSGSQGARPASTFSFFDDLTSAPPAPAIVAQQQQPPQNLSFGTFQENKTTTNDNEDDWGDFEGGDSAAPAPPASVNHDPFAFTTSQPLQPTLQPTWNNAPVKQDPFEFSAAQVSQPSWGGTPSATPDPFGFTSMQPSQSAESSWQKAPVVKAKKSADPSVLFDAEDDFDDDDDFGDFEGSESNSKSAPPPPSSGLADLLGDMSISQPQPQITKAPEVRRGSAQKGVTSPSTKKRQTGGFGSVARAKEAKAIPSAVPKEDDSWDTFDDWEASIPTKAAEKAPPKPKESKTVGGSKNFDPQPVLSPTWDDPQPGESPPTNVPPPGVLLTLFPPLFADAQNKLFKPMAAQTLPMRNKILAEQATITYLQGYLMLASVAARIIAGRKLRWKRDKHLSQGMRIGPASSRATSGMKLTGIDKSENMKEEREAADVVRAWKDQIGRLRHVVSAANQIKAGTLGVIPDIQEVLPVRTLKQAEGGVPAPQPCMMCGLKRDERVGTAEQDIEDSFGEWWVDQVNMHRGCRNFWVEHQDTLRQH